MAPLIRTSPLCDRSVLMPLFPQKFTEKNSFSADFRKCSPGDFECEPPHGICIPKEKKCDGYFDCRNKRDEENCPSTGSNPSLSCDLDQFRCANGQKCIDGKLKCNYHNDCGDNSDEENCSEYFIPFGSYDIWTS